MNFIENRCYCYNCELCSLTTFILYRPLITSDTNIPFAFKRQNFSIYSTFSKVIGKSPGLTCDGICFYLLKSVTKENYITFSRILSLNSGLLISCPDDYKVCEGYGVCVFVYFFTILQNLASYLAYSST